VSTATGAAVFGRGVAFPTGLGGDGRVAWSAGHDNVRDCMRLILETEPGERLRLPAFGAGLRRFLFEPNVASTHRLIEERVTFALSRWEPRIRLTGVGVRPNPDDSREAVVAVDYRLVATGGRDRLTVAVAVGG